MSFFSFFQTNCVNIPSAIIKYSFFSHPVWPKWINVGKFVTFNESYTYLALHSMLQDINHFPFLNKSMSIQRRGYICVDILKCYFVEFQSPVSWATVRGPFQILYLGKVVSFDRWIFCWVRVKIGITVEKVWMWSQMTVNRGLHVFEFL